MSFIHVRTFFACLHIDLAPVLHALCVDVKILFHHSPLPKYALICTITSRLFHAIVIDKFYIIVQILSPFFHAFVHAFFVVGRACVCVCVVVTVFYFDSLWTPNFLFSLPFYILNYICHASNFFELTFK